MHDPLAPCDVPHLYGHALFQRGIEATAGQPVALLYKPQRFVHARDKGGCGRDRIVRRQRLPGLDDILQDCQFLFGKATNVIERLLVKKRGVLVVMDGRLAQIIEPAKALQPETSTENAAAVVEAFTNQKAR